MLLALTYILFAVLLLGEAAMLLSQRFWMFSLPTEVVPQFTVVALFCALLLALQRRFFQTTILLIVIAFAAWPLLSLYVPRPSPAYSAETGQQKPLSVMSVNVNHRNAQYDDLRNRIAAEQPSIILLQEVTDIWIAALTERIGDAYPHHVLVPEEEYRGMAVFSKLPIATHQTLFYAAESPPVLKVTFSNSSLTVFTVHTVSPVTEQWTAERNGMLAWLVPQIRSISGPVIIAGDFNMTNTNPLFRDFLFQADLEDTRAGNGWRPTWERGTLMAAAIDQILYRGVAAHGFDVLDAIGSDHNPIISRFTVSQRNADE